MVKRVRSTEEFGWLASVDDTEKFDECFPGSKAEVMQLFITNINNPKFGAWYSKNDAGDIDCYFLAIDSRAYPLVDAVSVLYLWSADNVLNHRDVLTVLVAWTQEVGATHVQCGVDPSNQALCELYRRVGFSDLALVMEKRV